MTKKQLHQFLESLPFLKAEVHTPRDFFRHLLFMFLLLVLGVAIVFFAYLPITTRHGEALTVPDLRGMTLAEATQFLHERDLRYFISDSSYSGSFPPMSILLQNPKEGAKVKRDRVIYLTINARKAPMVQIPNIIDSSIKNAEQQLGSFGLRMGEVRYAPHPHSGRVLAIWIDSTRISADEIAQGYKLPKNTVISLEVGDGIGQAFVKLPNVVGMPVDEAEVYILGVGLHVKALHYMPKSTAPIGQVVQQQPAAGQSLKRNQGVDLWVSGGH